MDADYINTFSAFNHAENNGFARLFKTADLISTGDVNATQPTNAALSSNPDKSKSLYGIAHDLKNPLATIISLTELVLKKGQLTDEIKQYINHIRTIADNSLKFTEEIIYAGTLQSSEAEKELCSIDDIIADALSLLKYKAFEKQQTIIFEKEQQPVTALINKAQLVRVINNVVSNAIKFTNTGKSIKTTVKNIRGTALICVQDEGIGIPDSLRPDVFNAFTIARRTGTSGESSSGLGLSICKQIIEKHNGNIWFEGMPNGGTSFYIRIPASS